MVARKKKSKTYSFGNVLGINNIFNNEKINFITGLAAFVFAIFLIMSFISFFSTGAADQSLIETPRAGEIMNAEREFQNSCGSFGSYLSYFFIKRCFGLPAFFIPVFFILVAMKLMRVYNVVLLKWFMCMMSIMIWASVVLAKFITPLFIDSCFNPGGDHGAYICIWIENLIGSPGLTALLGLTAIIFLTYISAETIYVVRKILNPVKFFTDRVKFTVSNNECTAENKTEIPLDILEDPEVFDNPAPQTVEFDTEESITAETDVAKEIPFDLPVEKENDSIDIKIEAAKNEEKADGKLLVGTDHDLITPYDPKRDLENYHYPTLDLLKKYDNDGKPYIDMVEQTANKNRIVEVLRNFGVEISSIKATVGPTITLYEITPAQGVRISKIRNLEDDIALSLSALGIRIIAPIPGKGTIGIEVPNAKPNIVSMESILNSKKFQETTMELPCAIGKTITNEVFMFDLAKIPHLLVAGATGQGKSVGLNAIITSLLYKKHPAELKIVLIDPKKVEFSIYEPIANHFLAKVPDDDAEPIITDVTKVVRTLNSLCKEMDTRYKHKTHHQDCRQQ